MVVQQVLNLSPMVKGIAQYYKVPFDWRIFLAQIDVESSGNPQATSTDTPCGNTSPYPHSYGLFQITPACGNQFGLNTEYDAMSMLINSPAFSIEQGIKLVLGLYYSNNENIGEALSQYNSGSSSSSNGADYVKAVMDRLPGYLAAVEE